MNITLTRHTQRKTAQRALRAFRSDHQRQKAKQAAENFIAWAWIAFIVVLVAGSVLQTVGAW